MNARIAWRLLIVLLFCIAGVARAQPSCGSVSPPPPSPADPQFLNLAKSYVSQICANAGFQATCVASAPVTNQPQVEAEVCAFGIAWDNYLDNQAGKGKGDIHVPDQPEAVMAYTALAFTILAHTGVPLKYQTILFSALNAEYGILGSYVTSLRKFAGDRLLDPPPYAHVLIQPGTVGFVHDAGKRPAHAG